MPTFTPELVFGPYVSGMQADGAENYRTLQKDLAIANLQAQAALGGQPALMGSPPTITSGLANAATTVPSPGAFTAWNASGKYTFLNGTWAVAGGVYPADQCGRGQTVNYASNGSDSNGIVTAFETICTGRYYEIQTLGKGNGMRLLVEGQLSGNTLPTYPTDGSLYRTLIDFGSAATRKLRIEHNTAGEVWFLGAITEATASFTSTPLPTLRLVIVGDSFVEGTGTTPDQAAALASRLGYELGFKDFLASGSGATGWVRTLGGPARINLFDRWTLDVLNRAPTMVICLMGLNDVNQGTDTTVQANASACIAALNLAYPTCLIHVFDAYDVQAPGVSATGFDDLTVRLQAACLGKPRTTFHSLKGVSFTKSDATHPDGPGYLTLFTAIYNKIAAVYGLHTV